VTLSDAERARRFDALHPLRTLEEALGDEAFIQGLLDDGMNITNGSRA
jgi:hypothetical protein